jgi:hypothetical protein
MLFIYQNVVTAYVPGFGGFTIWGEKAEALDTLHQGKTMCESKLR